MSIEHVDLIVKNKNNSYFKFFLLYLDSSN